MKRTGSGVAFVTIALDSPWEMGGTQRDKNMQESEICTGI